MADLDGIRLRLADELEPSRKHGERGKYICPLCGSGTGSKGTAAFSIEKDGIHGKCFSCNFYGDIFDLCAAREGIEPKEATRRMIDKYEPVPGVSVHQAKPSRPDPAPSRDLRGEVERAHNALQGSPGEAYLLERGLTHETIERFRLGYEENHYFPGKGSFPAICIPYSPAGNYAAWRAVGAENKAFDKPSSDSVGEEPVFNRAVLKTGEPVFVVESQLCAISIEQEGGKAVSIGGTGFRKLEKQIEAEAPAGTLILCLDNDPAGEKTTAELAAYLERKGISFIKANIAGEAKDPNELLQHGKHGELRENIKAALKTIEEAAKRAEAERLEEYTSGSAGGALEAFFQGIEQSKSYPEITTGFTGLNKLLEGGLYPGLYILGAITSLGKTDFMLQLADNIAEAGIDVIYITLEMAQKELISRSLSRLTYQLAKDTRNAKTALGILSGKRWSKYSREEMELIARAADLYKARSGGRIWFVEGVGNIGIEQIVARVERHINLTGRLPVLMVDYLQILAPADMRASDKQNTDKAVLELKRLSRDKGIPIVAISSLNRQNYTDPINNAAFKESGAIEYGSDCLIGLQIEGMDYESGEADKTREKRIRELINEQNAKVNEGGKEDIELKILKFRNGRKGTRLRLSYCPKFHCYEEKSEYTRVEDDEGNPFTKGASKRKPI